MSLEGRIAVIERIVREEEILLKEFREKLEHYKRSVPALEESLEENIKKLEELRNEARKGRLQQNSGPGGENPPG